MAVATAGVVIGGEVLRLARQLYDARKSRTQLRHFSKQYPSMTIEDGYAIQRAWVRLEQADGHRIVVGHQNRRWLHHASSVL